MRQYKRLGDENMNSPEWVTVVEESCGRDEEI